jgi:hypothetical protein
MKKYIFLIVFCILVSLIQAQVIFQKTISGLTGNDNDGSMVSTNDGGYIICGSTQNFGANTNNNIYLIKLSSTFDTLWTKTYGGLVGDEGSQVVQTNDNGFMISGSTSSFGTCQSSIFLLKTDSVGNQLWSRTYCNDDYNVVNSIKQTTDHGYIMGGYIGYSNGYNEAYFMKTDSIGDTLWIHDLIATMGEVGVNEIEQTTDGGYIILLDLGQNFLMMKYDQSGIPLWSTNFPNLWIGSFIHQTNDGGYVITGSTTSNTTSDVFLIKMNSNGDDTLWTKTYGGNNIDDGNIFISTSDNGFLIIAQTRSFGAGGFDIYLIKTDSLGDTLWTKTYGGVNDEYANSVIQTPDGGYFIVGSTQSFGSGDYDIYLIKTDSIGNSVCNQGNPHTQVGSLSNLTFQHGAGGGQPRSLNLGGASFTVMSGGIINTLCYTDGIDEIKQKENAINVYPNPASSILNIALSNISINEELVIFDVFGREIYNKYINGINTVLDVSHWSEGVYFYQITGSQDGSGETYRGKFIVN